MNNEPHQSILSEHKALEGHVFSLEIINDGIRYFEMMNQCHLVLTRNEKDAAHKRVMCEYNELVNFSNRLADEMQCLRKMCNRLVVKHRKLIDIWKEAVKK